MMNAEQLTSVPPPPASLSFLLSFWGLLYSFHLHRELIASSVGIFHLSELGNDGPFRQNSLDTILRA